MDVNFQKYIDNAMFVDGTSHIAALEGAIKYQGEVVSITPHVTGHLQRSINRLKDGNDYLVGTNVEYAAAVEFGTKRSRANPYMRPAAFIMKNKNVNLEEFNKYLSSIGKGKKRG